MFEVFLVLGKSGFFLKGEESTLNRNAVLWRPQEDRLGTEGFKNNDS